MALTNAQKKQLKTFVASNYAPKLRRSALKKFTLKAEKSGTGFLTAATARGKAKASAPAAPPPGPYDRYKALPGAVGTLEGIDRQSASHVQHAGNVNSWAGQVMEPMRAAGAQASQYYAGLGAQYAGMGQLPGYSPTATVGGGSFATPGSANLGIDQANIQGQGVAAAGTQASSYQGFMNEQAGRSLQSGIIGNLGAMAQQIPGIYNEAKQAYMQKLDQNLFQMEQDRMAAETEMAMNDARMANDRYIAQSRLIGSLTGTQAKVNIAAGNNRTRSSIANANNRTKSYIASMDQATKRMVASEKARIDRAKIAVSRAKTTSAKKKANTALLRQVQSAFDKLWQGEPGDQIAGVAPTGWRHTARSGDKSTRAKATLQVIGWLQSTGLAPAQMHRLMRSKGFSDREFALAVQRLESGAGF